MSEEPQDPADATEAKATEPAAQPDTLAAESDDAAAEPKTSVQPGSEPRPDAKPADDDDAVLDAKGRERPRFLLSFPQHPDRQRLPEAFEAGNYALVRAEAEALAERAERPAVRDAALELRRRIDPDPLAKYLLALTAALLLSLAYFAYHH